MPTRQQQQQQNEFEKSLVDALKSSDVADAICEAIIKTITTKFYERFNYYDAKIKSLEAELELLKSTDNNSRNNIADIEDQKKLEQKVENLQQLSKRNNVRLIGLREVDNEETLATVKELFSNKLKINMEKSENRPLVAYRVGQQSHGRPRHIVVTFSNTSAKNSIYNKKKMLKGSGVVMKEDLTMERLKIVRTASEKYGFKGVWTFNGTVYAKTEKGVEKLM